MSDSGLGFILLSFARIAMATSSSVSYRRIDADIRNFCVKRPARTKDLRERLSRIFRLQQWSDSVFARLSQKAFPRRRRATRSQPGFFKISTFSLRNTMPPPVTMIACSSFWTTAEALRFPPHEISFHRVWQKFLESTSRSSKQRFRPYRAKPNPFVGADNVQRKICRRPSCQ